MKRTVCVCTLFCFLHFCPAPLLLLHFFCSRLHGCSITTDRASAHGRMLSFVLPLKSVTSITSLPDRTGLMSFVWLAHTQVLPSFLASSLLFPSLCSSNLLYQFAVISQTSRRDLYRYQISKFSSYSRPKCIPESPGIKFSGLN